MIASWVSGSVAALSSDLTHSVSHNPIRMSSANRNERLTTTGFRAIQTSPNAERETQDMGCDIHLYVECRDNASAPWRSADTWREEAGERSVPYEKAFYSGRNYDLFSILADVRNGTGFAGNKTGDGFVPISKPRGLPDDVSKPVADVASRWQGDGHSHSHLTVAEIMAYDWTQTTNRSGVVQVQEFARYKAADAPTSWASDSWGGKVVHHETADFERVLLSVLAENGTPGGWWAYLHDRRGLVAKAEAALGEGQSHYTRISWPVFYYEAGAEFLSETLPKLWRLGSPENVRIVFFFDN